jgi:DNA-binding transcriptional LysR family regulator
MMLDQLQIFIAVAEREHVTRAAEASDLLLPPYLQQWRRSSQSSARNCSIV